MTGSRADVIIYDDVEVPNTADTALKRADLRARLDESRYILVPNGVQLYIGTPHCYESLYKSADKNVPCYLDGFKRLELPLLDEQGRSVWPERFTDDAIDALRRQTGPRRFSAQMLLQPQTEQGCRLDASGLVPYRDALVYREAQKRGSLSLQGRQLVSATCWWDPAWGEKDRGCGSVAAVVYCDREGKRWLHRVCWFEGSVAAEEDVDSATKQCRQLIDLMRACYLSAVHIEVNGLGRFLPSILRREMRTQGFSRSGD